MYAYSNSYIKVYLYDDSGNAIAITPGTPVTSGSSGFIVFGVDGSGLATAFSVDSSGSLSIQNPPNLDVPLSTLLTEAGFNARINTLGQKAMTGSTPVVIASDQTAIPVTGTIAIDTAGLLTEATFTASINTLGQKAMTGSTPVVIASDQSPILVSTGTGSLAVEVTGTVSTDNIYLDAPISGLLTEATFTASVNTLGQKTMTGSTPVVIASDQSPILVSTGTGSLTVDVTGSVTVDNVYLDAPISGLLTEATFTSSVNTLGQKTMTGSTPVVIASDQTAIPVTDNSGSLTVDNVYLDAPISGLLAESTFTASINTLGQKTMTGSTPVVIASDQSAIPVTDNSGSLTIDNIYLDAPLSDLLTEATFTASVNTLGQKAMTGSTPVVIASDQTAIPVTDNSGSLTIDNPFIDANISTLLTEAGFNARINTLGQKEMTGSTPVVIASDQSRILVESTIADSSGVLADIIVRNGQGGLKIEYPLLLEEVKEIKSQLIKIVKHLQSITDEEWDENDDD